MDAQSVVSERGLAASYASNAVSLPFEQTLSMRVESMVSEEVSSTVIHSLRNMLLTEAELGAVLQNTELPGLYMDPVLQDDPSKYGQFVASASPFCLFGATRS